MPRTGLLRTGLWRKLGVGSARRLEKLGFKALASTSAGYAWTLGRQDGELTLHEVLDHLLALGAATDLPVNADFEAGFADQPDSHNLRGRFREDLIEVFGYLTSAPATLAHNDGSIVLLPAYSLTRATEL